MARRGLAGRGKVYGKSHHCKELVLNEPFTLSGVGGSFILPFFGAKVDISRTPKNRAKPTRPKCEWLAR